MRLHINHIFPALLLVCFVISANAQSKYTPVSKSFYNEVEDATYEYALLYNEVTGPIKKYQDDDLVMEGYAILGKQHSQWKQYDNEGNTLAEVNYTMGKKNGSWKIWDEEGNLRYKYQYRNGKPTGSWFMYSENGEVIQKKSFKR